MRKAGVALLMAACAGSGLVGADDGAELFVERWRFRGPTSRIEEKLGRRSLYLKETHAYLGDVMLADGVLEVDIAVPRQRTFVGVLFRVVSEGNQERVYLRPHKSGLDDALQYEPNFEGSSTWQLFSAPQYMRPSEVPKEQWFRFRVVFAGTEARVYVDGSETPAMLIADLKRGRARGGIGLWGGPGGAWFSNLRYEAAPAPPPTPSSVPSYAPGVVTTWELSDAFDAEDALPESLPTIAKWERVPVEPPGILVIDRHRKSTGVLPPSMNRDQRLGRAKGRRVVYARLVVASEREQVKRLSLGYSDEVCVFLNGRIAFTGHSPFRFRDPGFMGVMDVESDAIHLPLRKGRNEIVMAVAEYFGGWGVAARFDDATGLVLP